MSEYESSRSKTITETGASSATDDDALLGDRWTNNITYRHLVMSSCAGIIQFWWHPYVHSLSKLLPFLFLYQVLSVIVGYTFLYLEFLMGVVTQKGVLKCWDLSPMARGAGFAMIMVSLFTGLCFSAVASYCLALFIHSMHSFLPWLHCAASANPACAARHRPLPNGTITPAHSFFINFVLHLKKNNLDGGLGSIVWELTSYCIVSWLLIYLIAVKRLYSYSKAKCLSGHAQQGSVVAIIASISCATIVFKIVLFKDFVAHFILLISVLGVWRMEGSDAMFTESDWSALSSIQFWREALEYSLVQTLVATGTMTMFGTFKPRPTTASYVAMGTYINSKLCVTCSALVLGGTHGALRKDYESETGIEKGASASLILWSDFVARIPGSQFWSAIFFLTFFVLAVSSAALQIQTVMSTFTGRSIRRLTWAFLILTCLLLCFISIMTLCTQGGIHILNFLMEWPVSRPRAFIAMFVAAVITYAYGQSEFCTGVYLASGAYPNVLARVCWALTPFLFIIMFLASLGAVAGATESALGWMFVTMELLPIPLVVVFYMLFKFRVRNIVTSDK